MTFKKLFATIFSTMLVSAAFAQTNNVESNEEVAKPKMKKYDKLLTIAPIQFTENGVGFSIAYEQAIDKEGIVAYNLPLVATFDLSNNNNNSYYGYYGVRQHQDAMFYFMPGLKFYPTGSHGKVKYAIGPSVVVGAGEYTSNDYYYQNTRDKFILGIMVNNSLNMNVTKNLYMGLELGFGFTYLRQYDGVTQNMGGLAQGAFKMGLRF